MEIVLSRFIFLLKWMRKRGCPSVPSEQMGRLEIPVPGCLPSGRLHGVVHQSIISLTNLIEFTTGLSKSINI